MYSSILLTNTFIRYFFVYFIPLFCINLLIYLFIWIELKTSQLQRPEGGYAPQARLARPVNHTPGIQSTGVLHSTSSYLKGARRGRCAHAWHRVNIRVSSSFEGGTERTVRKRKRGRERDRTSEWEKRLATIAVHCNTGLYFSGS